MTQISIKKIFFLLHPIVRLCLKSLKKQKFWQGIPRFPRRWRTQRSAIVIAICKCTWIIKFSNAVCICGLLLQICLIDRSTPRQPFVCCLRLCEWWIFFSPLVKHWMTILCARCMLECARILHVDCVVVYGIGNCKIVEEFTYLRWLCTSNYSIRMC